MRTHTHPARIVGLIAFATLFTLFVSTTLAALLVPAFNYQSKLTDGANPANGS